MDFQSLGNTVFPDENTTFGAYSTLIWNVLEGVRLFCGCSAIRTGAKMRWALPARSNHAGVSVKINPVRDSLAGNPILNGSDRFTGVGIGGY